MKNFTCVQDIGNLKTALDEAFEIKKDRFKYVELGRKQDTDDDILQLKSVYRLSTQKAALNLGMNVIVLTSTREHGNWKPNAASSWTATPEHLLEAAPYGLLLRCYRRARSFSRSAFENREYDYNEVILNQFIKYPVVRYSLRKPPTRHPPQSFADLITIE